LARRHHPALPRPVVHVPPDVAGLRNPATIARTSIVEPRLLSSISARVALAALELGVVAAGVVSRVAVAEPLCRLAGSAWYVAAPSSRRAVRDNLRRILAREPRSSEVRAVFQSGALNYWDTFALAHLDRDELIRLVTIHGLEHLDAALTRGRGVILAGAHLGSLALVGMVLPARGYRMLALVEPIKPPEVFDFFVRRRAAFGARLLPATPSSLRELLTALRNNELIGLVSDRDVTGTGLEIEFFGAPTRFADGAAALAVRTGAPILPAVAIRRPDGTFEGWIEPPVQVAEASDSKLAIRALTQAVALRLEYYVANYPEQWTVFQTRWPAARPG
jgi:lauroyl/myristoyl acyltransferase